MNVFWHKSSLCSTLLLTLVALLAILVISCSSGGSSGSSGQTGSIAIKLRHSESGLRQRNVAATNVNGKEDPYLNRLLVKFYADAGDHQPGDLLLERDEQVQPNQETVLLDSIPAPQDYYIAVDIYYSDSEQPYTTAYFTASALPGQTVTAIPIQPTPTPTPTSACTIDITNAYGLDITETKYALTLQNSQGETVTADGTTPYQVAASANGSQGSCTIVCPEAVDETYSVISVTLSDPNGEGAFEWLDYDTPQPLANKAITLDVQQNEFANGAYVDDATECLVANPRQLNGVRKHLNGKFRQIKDIDFEKSCGIKVVVADEAYCAEATDTNAPFYHVYDDGCDTVSGWVPIGSMSNSIEDRYPFTGTYDGGGYKIANLICDRWRDENRNSNNGLFGAVDSATIANVTIDDTCAILAREAGAIIGALQCELDDKKTTVRNCISSGRLYVNAESGGIVGTMELHGNHTLAIDNCVFNGIIEAQREYKHSKTYTVYNTMIGGICGSAYSANGITLNISDCTFSGKIINSEAATSCAKKSIQCVGGILGNAKNCTCTLVNCTNAGTMRFSTYNCGGAVGVFQGVAITLKNCQVTGTLEFECAQGANIGNIGGLLGDAQVVPTFALNSNCESNIAIADPTTKTVGGLIGYCPNTVSDIKAAMVGNVGTPGFVGGDAAKQRGKYCGDPWLDSLD